MSIAPDCAQEEHTHMRSQAWTLDTEYYYITAESHTTV